MKKLVLALALVAVAAIVPVSPAAALTGSGGGTSCTFTGGHNSNAAWANRGTCASVQAKITMHVDGTNRTYLSGWGNDVNVFGGTGTFAGAAAQVKVGTIITPWYGI